MIINSWNVRGINASDKRHRIKQAVDSMNADIVMLQETKLSQQTFHNTIAKWHRWKSAHILGVGAFGRLTILWNPKTISGQVIHQDKNWQMMKVVVYDISFILVNVYGPTATQDKSRLWVVITQFIQAQDSLQIIIGGDFNALLSQREKIGGIFPPPKTMQDFNYFVQNNNLMDVCPANGSFTWTNKRSGFAHIAARLDRFLLSQEWKLLNMVISSHILSVPGSDHFPISLNIKPSFKPTEIQFHSSFKFERMWLRHPQFLSNMYKWWQGAPYVAGTKMHQFAMKLKYVKLQIKSWNQNVFKNIFTQKSEVKKQLENVLTTIIQNGMDEDTFTRQKMLQQEWDELCTREEMYWRQKSRELWLQEGDRNTKFFHAIAKQKRASKTIFQINDADSGVSITNENLIREEGVKFFKNLLAPNSAPSPSEAQVKELLETIPTMISSQDNIMLMAPFMIQEI